MKSDLAGKVAMVTGGAGAIGKTIVQQLVAEGARVFSLDVAECEVAGVASLTCDFREPLSVSAAFEVFSRQSDRLDILVYAAGVSRDAVIWKMSIDDWDFVQSVNVRGAFLAIRHAVPMMRAAGGGRIVLIGSINGSRGKRGTSAYSASKAALIGLAKSVCRETGSFGILVNVVEPGWVRTPMTDSFPAEVRENALKETLLGELVEREDVAAAVTFLCGTGGRHITGQVLRVDAGQYLGA